MKLLTDFIARLTSRKFLMVVAVILSMVFFPGMVPDEALIAVLAYVGIEGGRDIVAAVTASKVAVQQLEKDMALINAGQYTETTTTGDTAQNKPAIVPGGM